MKRFFVCHNLIENGSLMGKGCIVDRPDQWWTGAGLAHSKLLTPLPKKKKYESN